MTLRETLAGAAALPADASYITEVEGTYKMPMPDDVKRILSVSGESVPYDDHPLLRGLSRDEILEASEVMAVDFIESQLLPLFDAGDNVCIVYDLAEDCWYKFDIVDEVKFMRADAPYEYLREG